MEQLVVGRNLKRLTKMLLHATLHAAERTWLKTPTLVREAATLAALEVEVEMVGNEVKRAWVLTDAIAACTHGGPKLHVGDRWVLGSRGNTRGTRTTGLGRAVPSPRHPSAQSIHTLTHGAARRPLA